MKCQGVDPAIWRAVQELPSPDGGFRMSELLELGESNRFDVVAVQRLEGDQIPVPSVVHWKLNHYAAIVSETGGRYKVIDPTFGGAAWMEASTINEEASGRFLVASSNVVPGWKQLTSEEAAVVRGKG